ncbi:MAG: hypothetical protein ACLFSR_09205 [Halomonas sp.]
MKRSNLIMTALVAGIFTMGMTSQATAATSSQPHLQATGPAMSPGGTREGIRQPGERLHPRMDDAEYRIAHEAGSPILGGTREGLHRKRVSVESHQGTPRSMERPDHASLEVSGRRQGTRN